MNEGPVWVALRNDAIVGTVSVVPKGDRLYIRGMAVLPNARALGIGERLLEVINTYACNGKFRGLFLSTTPFLARAIQLYEHSGFKRTAERPHDLFGTPLFTMEKQL